MTPDEKKVVRQIVHLLEGVSYEDATIMLLSGAAAYAERCGPVGEELARNIANLVRNGD